MPRPLVAGFLLGPVILVAALLVWSTAGLMAAITAGVLLGAFVVAVLAGVATGRNLRRKPPGDAGRAPPKPR
jgi:hypothetical protein